MAITGTLTGSFSKVNTRLSIYIDYSYTQDINNNTTTLTTNLRVKKISSYAQTYKSYAKYTIGIEEESNSGTKSYDCKNSAVGSYVNIATKTSTIPHNEDGTRQVKISGTYDLSGTSIGLGTVSGTITLQTIPRASSATLENDSILIGNKLNVSINSNSDTFNHKIKFYINDEYSSSLINLNTSKTYECIIPNSWNNYSEFKTNTSIKAYIDLYTYSDSEYSNLIGTTTIPFTIKIDTSPEYVTGDYFTIDTINVSVVSNDSNIYDTFLLNKTMCKFNNINIVSNTNSDISYIKIVGSDGYDSGFLNYSANMSHTTSVITKSGVITYNIQIIDSRGVTVSKEIAKITVLEYILPKFTNIISSRADKIDDTDEYVDSDTGTRLKSQLSFSYFIEDVNNNIKTIEISYEHNGSITRDTYIYNKENHFLLNEARAKTYYGILQNDEYVYTVYSDTILDIDTSYTINYSITDSYNTIVKSDVLSTSYFIIDIAPGGKSIAIGKSANEEVLGLEVAMPLKFSFKNNTYEFNNLGLFVNGNKTHLMFEKFNSVDTSASVILNNVSYYYCYKKPLQTLNISLDNSIFNNACITNKINFSTSSAIDFTADNNIYFIGTNCTDGVFAPSISSFYSIEFENAASKILGKVVGFSMSSDVENPGGGGDIPPEIIIPPVEIGGPEPLACASNLTTLANTYYSKAKNDNYFEYKDNQTVLTYGLKEANITSQDSKKYIDDCTFVGLVLRGIDFNNSRYSNWSFDSEFNSIDYEWALDLRDTLSITSVENGGNGIKSAAEIGEYFYNRGWILDSNLWNEYNFVNLKKGDIIFWDDDNIDNNKWNNISRIGICMGTDIDEDEWTAKGYDLQNEDITVLECTSNSSYSGNNYGIRLVKLKDSNPEKIVHIGRLQYKTYKTGKITNSSYTGANLRTGPSSDINSDGTYVYDVIGFVNNGNTVKIVDETNGRSKKWYKVKYEVTSGDYSGRMSAWLSSTLITLDS